MSKYAIGVDYGTQSGRVVIVNVETGEEIADHVTMYPHGVITEKLPEEEVYLEKDWALQQPADYLKVLEISVPAAMRQANINGEDIIGIGIDFTACTMLPVDKQLQPLCFNPKYRSNPHSWVKLWKHHAAQDEADVLNKQANETNESFLKRYGGKISSEWMFAKVWQILNEAPQIYDETDQFIEATDWVISQLTGQLKKNTCTAGYKAIWHKEEGYPSETFLKRLHPKLEHLTTTKLRGKLYSLGTKAGVLQTEIAQKLNLPRGIAIAVGNVDAHAAVPAMGVTTPNKMVMAMGTSICHMVLYEQEVLVPGICGVVEDGIIPGYYGYEAGQSAVGDIFEWFVTTQVPQNYYEKAMSANQSIHQYLEQLATLYSPGETGLLALDWWNGNRTVLVDANLTGVVVGYTLQTKPEEMYRTLLESTAFGTKKIIETFEQSNIQITSLHACGGLPQKNKLLMQIFADVCNLPIYIADSQHTPAVGAAMFASVAAGKEVGGYETIEQAAEKMAKVRPEPIQPIATNVAIYKQLYEEYSTLHDYFGKGVNPVMKLLKKLKR